MCVFMCFCGFCYVFLCISPTYSLWGENLCEPSREGDKDHRVGDPRQILKKDVAVQATVHPFLCCGHTHTHRNKTREYTHAGAVCVCLFWIQLKELDTGPNRP